MFYNIGMIQLSLSQYLKSPCSVSSIPYWKTKNLDIPKGMLIIHDSDFVSAEYTDYVDETYFRLYHDLRAIGPITADGIEFVAVSPDRLDNLVETINASYADLSVTKEQLESYMKTPVYSPDLWILLKDSSSGKYIGSGIADYDKDVGELIIEWVQVLPEYRNRGYGKVIVNYLLNKMQDAAKFATVSGKINDSTHPERLYRKCGFKGNDIWHILCGN